MIYRIGSYIVVVILLLITMLGCQHNTLGGTKQSNPTVYSLSFTFNNIDTIVLYASSFDSVPAVYSLYTVVRDSLSLRRAVNLPLSINGTITNAAGIRQAVFTQTSATTDTIHRTGYHFGSDTLIYWKIFKPDTGTARIQLQLFNSTGSLIRQQTNYYTVAPAPQG